MWPNPQKKADLVTFTEEILNGNLRFLCSVGRLMKTWLKLNTLIFRIWMLCDYCIGISIFQTDIFKCFEFYIVQLTCEISLM